MVLVGLLLTFAVQPAAARSRIKDIVDFEGVRDNQLVGYGMVIGLAGTGDSLRNIPFTQQSLQSMLERLGVYTRLAANIDTKNVAAVMVTANLKPFAGAGSRMDVSVSAMGDSKSLAGGTLVGTPLQGPDNEIYAVAQGTVQTGAVSAQGASGSSISRGVPTAGNIADGAIVERSVGYELPKHGKMHLTLRNPDFNTAKNVAAAINAQFPGTAVQESGTSVVVDTPTSMSLVDYITTIGSLEVDTDEIAKVVIDEANGVIVVGQNVRVSPVAIDHGNITISVQETPKVSQPAPFSQGQTVVTPNSQVKVDEEKGKKLVVLDGGASLASLVKGLNALGVTPRDMISILMAIKRAGALQADVEQM
jgi:flagellar P-ring protein precursor FlgI